MPGYRATPCLLDTELAHAWIQSCTMPGYRTAPCLDTELHHAWIQDWQSIFINKCILKYLKKCLPIEKIVCVFYLEGFYIKYIYIICYTSEPPGVCLEVCVVDWRANNMSQITLNTCQMKNQVPRIIVNTLYDNYTINIQTAFLLVLQVDAQMTLMD